MAVTRPRIGERVPDARFVDVHERPWTLADHVGRMVVVIFHRHIH